MEPTAPNFLSVDPTALGQSYGTNPYAAMLGSDSAAATSGINQANQQMNNMGMQSQAFGGASQSSAYPSYPNSYGLGSQNPMSGYQPAAPTQAAPMLGSTAPAPTTSTVDPSSRGFNPWSLQGESNAR